MSRPGSDSQVTHVFAVVAGRFVPIRASTDWPDDFDSGIAVVRGSDGRVQRFQEEPRSESGDWFLVQQHFFDARGRTSRYESVGRFVGECPNKPLEAIYSVDYDTAFRATSTTRTLRDNTGASLDPARCGHAYEFFDGEPVESFVELVRRRRAPPDAP